MKRNLKIAYLKKLAAITTKNGYKCDLANYVQNPHLNHTYPNFKKVIEETEEKTIVSAIYFFKYYGGTAEIIKEVYSIPKDKSKFIGGWFTAEDRKETVLADLGKARFNLNQLLEYCENN